RWRSPRAGASGAPSGCRRRLHDDRGLLGQSPNPFHEARPIPTPPQAAAWGHDAVERQMVNAMPPVVGTDELHDPNLSPVGLSAEAAPVSPCPIADMVSSSPLRSTIGVKRQRATKTHPTT